MGIRPRNIDVIEGYDISTEVLLLAAVGRDREPGSSIQKVTHVDSPTVSKVTPMRSLLPHNPSQHLRHQAYVGMYLGTKFHLDGTDAPCR